MMDKMETQPLLDENKNETDTKLTKLGIARGNSVLARFHRHRFISKIRNTHMPKTVTMVLLTVLTVTIMVINSTTLPMAVTSATEAGGDGFTLYISSFIWTFPMLFITIFIYKIFLDYQFKIFPRRGWVLITLSGVCLGLQSVALVLSAHPSRTPPYIQSLLIGLMIPSTVAARFILLKKGINRKQTVCILVLFVGLFVSLVPSMFLEDQTVDPETQGKWYFSLINALGWIPPGVSFVLMEKFQDETGFNILVILTWSMPVAAVTGAGLTWLNVISGLGMAPGPGQLAEHFQATLRCLYQGDPRCSTVLYLSLLVYVTFTYGWIFSLLLIQLEGGATYSALVQALQIPIGTLFWTFFTLLPYFHWHPTFSTTTICVLVGLLLMGPAVGMYTYTSGDSTPGNEKNSGKSKDIKNHC